MDPYCKGSGNKLKPVLDKLEKWTEEKTKASEMKLKLYEKELDLIEAEIFLEEAIEDMDEELKRREKEEEKKMEIGLEEKDNSALSSRAEKAVGEVEDDKVEVEVEEEDEEDEQEEEEDDNTPSSFGSVSADENPTKNDQKGEKPAESPFSSSSLSFASCSFVSSVPSMLEQSFLSWKRGRLPLKPTAQHNEEPDGNLVRVDSVSFPPMFSQKRSLRGRIQTHQNFQTRNHANGRTSQLRSLSRILAHSSASASLKGAHSLNLLIATLVRDFDSILYRCIHQ